MYHYGIMSGVSPVQPRNLQTLSPPRRRPSRAAIIDAAIGVLAGNPDASLATIAEAAGVGRATLYRHFPGRNDLIDAISRQAIEETDAAVRKIRWENTTSSEFLLAVFEAMVPLGDRYHFLMVMAPAAVDGEAGEAYARQLREVEEMMHWMRRDGTLAPDVPVDWAVLIVDSLIYAAWTAVRDGSVAPRHAAALACRTFLSGLSRGG